MIASPTQTAAIFTTSSKGGPGKSTFSTLLTDYYRTAGVVTAAYDADIGNETFSQFTAQRDTANKILADQDPLLGAKVFNIRDPRERDTLLNLIETASAQRIVVDLPGGGGEDVAAVLESTDAFFEIFEQAGIIPIVAIVISTVRAAAASVPKTIELFGKRPKYVVVKNLAFGNEFPAFDGLTLDGELYFDGPKRSLAEVDGEIIEMPRLSPETYIAWDIASVPLATATQHRFLSSTAPKARIDHWRRNFAINLRGTILEGPRP